MQLEKTILCMCVIMQGHHTSWCYWTYNTGGWGGGCQRAFVDRMFETTSDKLTTKKRDFVASQHIMLNY